MDFPAPDMPSVPPRVYITWPVVAYYLVRELPWLTMILGGTFIGALLVYHAPGTLQPLAAVTIPAIISALARSRPSEPQLPPRSGAP